LRRGNFGDSAINKRYIAYFSLRMLETMDVKNVQKRIKNVKKRKKRNENKKRL